MVPSAHAAAVPRAGLAAPVPHLAAALEALLRDRDVAAARARDPVGLVHGFRAAADQEVVGLVAASLAFGHVGAIRASVGRVLATLGPSPAAAIEERSPEALGAALRGFVHRVYRGADVAALLGRAAWLRRRHGSLGARFAELHAAARGELRVALARFADDLRGPAPSRGLRHLVPDPRAGSACKRLLLYLRWMVRGPDGVDLGLWPVSPSVLLVPVDTHLHRIGRNLGLTTRATASWRAAEEITSALRAYDPDDPVRYDFALCHLGISRDCPSQRDPARCGACVLRACCRHWRPAEAPPFKAPAGARARRVSARARPGRRARRARP